MQGKRETDRQTDTQADRRTGERGREVVSDRDVEPHQREVTDREE
jgi:hypothetical protein